MKAYGIVYKVTNTVNGKVYVGQTVQSLAARWRQHRCKTSRCGLYRAIKKYGDTAFRIEQIAIAYSAEELNRLESERIRTLGTMHPRGYNHQLESVMSEAARQRNSEAHRRYYEDPEARARNSDAQKICKGLPESRAAHSAFMRKRFEGLDAQAQLATARERAHTPEARAKNGLAQRLRLQNPEELAKHTAAIRRGKNTPTERLAQSARQKRRFEDPEQRSKIAALLQSFSADPAKEVKRVESLKTYFSNPANRVKSGEAIRRAKSTPEAKARQSAAQKARFARSKD